MHAWCNPQVAIWKLVSLWPSTADSGPWSEFHLDASWAPCASIWVPDWHPSLLWAGPAGTLIVMRNWKHPVGRQVHPLSAPVELIPISSGDLNVEARTENKT